MNNKTVGFLLFIISLIVGLIIFLFNRALVEIVNTSCSHGPSCPMWGSIDFHTNISLILLGIIFVLSIYFMFFAKEEKKIVFKSSKQKESAKQEPKPKNYNEILKLLSNEEKIIFQKIIDSAGAILQSELIDESKGFSKVKVSRILDKLEGRGLIERKRRGMSNIVVLKH
ncbi:MAG: hypothetical protein N3D10_01150 [Candidatus Micrarchaeota archaeon]|nr:hypothetical protein [Candidatus Micrarchaeota archaeon]